MAKATVANSEKEEEEESQVMNSKMNEAEDIHKTVQHITHTLKPHLMAFSGIYCFTVDLRLKAISFINRHLLYPQSQSIGLHLMTPIPELDCAVCLQKCNHPTQLPCGHVFCFLCVKGIAFQNKKCAMCRADIPPNYLENPILLGTLSREVNINTSQEVYQWFYEGRNGWWKYDERSNFELEAAFNAGELNCTLLLAGTLYKIDFQSMTQVRRSDQTRRRRVRRDTPIFPSKGIAGIKTDDTNARPVKSDDEESADVVHIPAVEEIIVISDNENDDGNEPTLIQLEYDDHIINRLSSINLQEPNISLDPDREDT